LYNSTKHLPASEKGDKSLAKLLNKFNFLQKISAIHPTPIKINYIYKRKKLRKTKGIGTE